MIILDNTYFQGELYLAGLKKSSSAVGVAKQLQAVNENSLEWYIEKYEVEFLNNLLGKQLASNFIKGLREDPVNEIWKLLRSSLMTKTDNYKYSPIANYVYFYLNRRGRTQTTTKGEVKAKQDHAVMVDDADKLSKIWNDMYYDVSYFYKNFLSPPNWNTYKAYSDRRFCHYDFGLINALDV